jgi:hypothetical protein
VQIATGNQPFGDGATDQAACYQTECGERDPNLGCANQAGGLGLSTPGDGCAVSAS